MNTTHTKRVCIAGLAIVTVTLVSGCRTTTAQKWNSPFANPAMDTAKLTPDVTVGQKVQGFGQRNVLFGFIKWGNNKYAENAGAQGNNDYVKAKKAAAYNALSGDGADILVGPQYTVTEKNYLIFQRYEAQATGFVGNFNNVRQVK
jgi:hypothetical protein